MIGINIDTLNSIINRVIDGNDNYINNSKSLLDIIDSLESCYDGNTLDYLFDGLNEKKGELKNIDKIIHNYIDVLNDVKISYIKQNQIFKEQINHINSNVQ